ncbi:hypothetical protein M9H77_07670 [Catharanthus roseus]|uniref:Uncharacterized protein n=1 Tax=Catharanthus roseus TaxID=4058 RepID=A0ACC0BVM9_CATRO|nr:hypothetical protein M9H77_07670 [Catharanthus roseus]
MVCDPKTGTGYRPWLRSIFEAWKQFQNFLLNGSEKLSIKVAEMDFKAGMEEYGMCYDHVHQLFFPDEASCKKALERGPWCFDNYLSSSSHGILPWRTLITHINHIHADNLERSVPGRKQHNQAAVAAKRRKKIILYRPAPMQPDRSLLPSTDELCIRTGRNSSTTQRGSCLLNLQPPPTSRSRQQTLALKKILSLGEYLEQLWLSPRPVNNANFWSCRKFYKKSSKLWSFSKSKESSPSYELALI